MSSAFHPKVAMPLKSEESMTMLLSLAGTTLMRKTHTAHNKIDDTANKNKNKCQ